MEKKGNKGTLKLLSLLITVTCQTLLQESNADKLQSLIRTIKEAMESI